jgi:hypothetical protein
MYQSQTKEIKASASEARHAGNFLEERYGYNFIHPVRLWKDWRDPRTERQAAKSIEDVMENL